jgi:hypothetical protein
VSSIAFTREVLAIRNYDLKYKVNGLSMAVSKLSLICHELDFLNGCGI